MRPTQQPESQNHPSQSLTSQPRLDRDCHFLARAGITASLLCLAASSVVAADTCDEARPLSLPTTLIAAAEPESAAWFSVEVEADRFLLVEAQGTGIGAHRPRVRLFDDRCRELETSNISEPKKGRRMLFTKKTATVLVKVLSAPDSRVFILDLWTDAAAVDVMARRKDGEGDETSPVPEVPIDEWDEIRGDGCRIGLAKSDEEEENPVPEVPIDEWDELRSPVGNCDTGVWRELRGLGAVNVTDRTVRSRSWCEWAGRPELLGTFSCARALSLRTEERATIERILADRPEMLALELDGAGVLELRGAGGWTVYTSAGDLVAAAGTEVLEPGSYFLQIHDPDPVYELTVLP